MKRCNLLFFSVVIGLAMVAGGIVGVTSIIHSRESSITPVPRVVPVAPRVSAVATAQTTTISGQPVAVTIPSLHLQLPIIPGYYNTATKTWTLTLNKVQYATISPEPNTAGGNTFLYGHYRPEVFAALHTIKTGAQAVVTTANGHTFYYELTGVRVVNPDDSQAVFGYEGLPILTLQTCTGLFFQQRQLFVFNLVKVA